MNEPRLAVLFSQLPKETVLAVIDALEESNFADFFVLQDYCNHDHCECSCHDVNDEQEVASWDRLRAVARASCKK